MNARRLAIALAGLVATACGGAAIAAPAFPIVDSVAIVAPGPPDPVVTEAVSRLRFELSVVGLASHPVTCADDAAAEARACARAQRLDGAPLVRKDLVQPAASIVVAREDGVVTLEVIEQLSNGSKFFRLVYVPAAEGGKDPSVLAIRGVELLRDVHLDVERTGAATIVPARITMTVPSPSPPVVKPVVAVADEPPAAQVPDPEDAGGGARATPATLALAASAVEQPAPGSRWGLHASLGLLQGRSGLGPSFGPALGAAFRLRTNLGLWGTLGGPFYEDLHQDVATVATRQELAMAGLRIDIGPRPGRLFVTAGAGVYHLHVAGMSLLAGEGPLASSLWAPLAVGGAGLSYPVGAWVDLAVEGQAFLTAPSGSIMVRDVVVGRTGAPSLLAQAELRVRLPY